MAALDTNVLVRFLVRDDAGQLASAEQLLRRWLSAGETIFIPVTVMLELEWVLRSRFGFGKPAIALALSHLLSSMEVSFESEAALELALLLHGQGSADFSDCLHIALASHAGEQPMWTFDKAAARVSGASLIAA